MRKTLPGLRSTHLLDTCLYVSDTLQETAFKRSAEYPHRNMDNDIGFTSQKIISIHQRGWGPGRGIDGPQGLLLLIIRLVAPPPRALLRPVHPEDGTDHAQEQRQLQEDQEQEADAAEKGPAGDTVIYSERRHRGEALVPSAFLLSLSPDPWPQYST